MFSRIAIILLATLPLTAQQPTGAGVNFYSLEKEAVLGKQLSVEVLQNATVVDSPAAQEYLNRLGQRIAAQLPGPKWTYSFTLVGNDEGGSTHEPLALPAGYVFVPAGLALAARDEAELAGMMAHAMAHVTARDWTRQATRANISAISMEVAAAQVAKQAGANGSTGYAVRQAQGLSMPLEMLSLARKSQMEADALGAKAMAGAGLSPEALVRYLDREQRDAPGGMAATSAETPDRDTRLAALRGAIKSLPASEYAPPNPEFATFQQDVRRSAPYPPPPPLKRDNEK